MILNLKHLCNETISNLYFCDLLVISESPQGSAIILYYSKKVKIRPKSAGLFMYISVAEDFEKVLKATKYTYLEEKLSGRRQLISHKL